jgi:hypothetical protein
VKEENGGVGPWTMCMTRAHQQHYVQRGGQVWGSRCMGDGYRSHIHTSSPLMKMFEVIKVERNVNHQ